MVNLHTPAFNVCFINWVILSHLTVSSYSLFWSHLSFFNSPSCPFIRHRPSVSLVSHFLPFILLRLYFPFVYALSIASWYPWSRCHPLTLPLVHSSLAGCQYYFRSPSFYLITLSFPFRLCLQQSLPCALFTLSFFNSSSCPFITRKPHALPSAFRIFRGTHSLSSRTSLPLTHTDWHCAVLCIRGTNHSWLCLSNFLREFPRFTGGKDAGGSSSAVTLFVIHRSTWVAFFVFRFVFRVTGRDSGGPTVARLSYSEPRTQPVYESYPLSKKHL